MSEPLPPGPNEQLYGIRCALNSIDKKLGAIAERLGELVELKKEEVPGRFE
jgi:hypothetical protein